MCCVMRAAGIILDIYELSRRHQPDLSYATVVLAWRMSSFSSGFDCGGFAAITLLLALWSNVSKE